MEFEYRDITSFSIFFSSSTTQSLLKNYYKKMNFIDSEQKSFENSYRFIYFLKQGQLYYKQAKIAPMSIKPTLLFYGLINFVKACILTVRPKYPESTTMLAHGVSARKKKKQQYVFLNDEVLCKKNGLFPIMAKELFGLANFEGKKITMEQLFANIPELNNIFHHLYKEKTFMKINQIDKNTYTLNKEIIDYYYMTENRFINFLKEKSKIPLLINNYTNENVFYIKTNDLQIDDCLPFKFNFNNSNFYLPLQNDFLVFCPEIITHYLLLYNLSMVARYETEWWYELLNMMPNDDFPFIESFLNITTEKSPFLLFHYLITNLGNF